jgi:hypothetical protein
MSLKTMLPFLGVGSAFAILGLCAARRPARRAIDNAPARREHRMQSGVHPRVSLAAAGDEELAALAPELTSDFWDPSPESFAVADSLSRPASEREAYDALDPEDLSAEWLTRATEAPPTPEAGLFDLDDPAEIPADSMSMVSEASRHAALDLGAFDDGALDDGNDLAADSRL